MSWEDRSQGSQADAASGSLLARLQQWVGTKPIGAFLVLIPAILVAEFLAMWLLDTHDADADLLHTAADTLVSLVILGPIVLLLFIVPTVRNLRRSLLSERALAAARDDLELRIRERTAELEAANRRLRDEIDERARAQQAIQFQASLLDAVEQAVVATDRRGHISYWNRFAEGLYGWSRGEVEGRRLADLVRYTGADGRPVQVPDSCRDPLRWTGEVDAERRDATRFPVYLGCSPLLDPQERTPHGYVFVSFDISERRRAEEALRRSEETYSSLAEGSPTGIFIAHQGRLEFVNPKFAEMLDEAREDLIGREVLPLLYPEDRDRLRPLAEPLEGGEASPGECECRVMTRAGKIRWVELRCTPIRYRGGLAILGNAQDVTDHRRMEAELRGLSARLLTIQEDERRRVARELHDSVGQTLTGIKFMVEAAVGTPPPGDRRSGTGRLLALVPAIQDAVEEVRRISTELRPSILDDLGLLPTLAWFLRELQKTHPRLSVESQIDAKESDIPQGLRTPIYRIVQEATNNLVKHSGASRLLLQLEGGSEGLRLRLVDDGVGFDPGARAAGVGPGGSGLSSMRERAELSGGRFSLTSAPGAGTSIEVTWPLDPVPSG